MGNERLHHAKREKNDEFYTRYEDIAKEVQHYKQHFKGKHVLLNANDAKHGYFWDYFNDHFVEYGLASLTATSYGEGAFKRVRDSVGTHETPLQGNGDFRSPEMLVLLEQSDVVVTNPPFSLFREYLPSLIESGKGFLVLGNQNAITYKEIWPYLQEGRAWLGVHSNKTLKLEVPDDYYAPEDTEVSDRGNRLVGVPAINWFTNLDHGKRHEPIPLTKAYNPAEYPKYDNYDAIEVSRVADIPSDYDGVMGVPITFLGKWNPDQFEVVGMFKSGQFGRDLGADAVPVMVDGKLKKATEPVVRGKLSYARILVKRKM